MSGEHPNIVALIFACIFFGYAMVNSLVFYRRARAARRYRSQAITDFTKTPRYTFTVWISGIIGAVGFAVTSWKLTLALWSMLHAPR